MSCVDAAACCQLAVVEKPLEARTIEALVDFEDLSKFYIFNEAITLLIHAAFAAVDDVCNSRGNPGLQVLDVLGVMEQAKFFWSCLLAVEHVEVRSEAVVVDETVHHLQPHGLHGVVTAQGEPGEVLIVEVAHFPHC